jgi:hypothetical protein
MSKISNTLKFAEKELDILVKSSTDPENRPLIESFIPEIIALCKKFGTSGQSGSSAPCTAKALSMAIEKLCLQQPICPIMGTDDEWNDVTDMNDGEPMWQNKRCSALFKYSDGNVKYLDAIVKRTQNGTCWSGSFWLTKKDYLNGDRNLKINSSQHIQGFPFTPKTFYIDVIEEEVASDDWESYLKDHSQLDEVYTYYRMPPITRKILIEKNNNSLLYYRK